MFYIQIKMFNSATQEAEWINLQKSDGEVYKFSSKLEADKIKNICYPQTSKNQVRVIEILDSI